MEFLHAYWRLDYIEAPKTSNTASNPFLEIPKATNDQDVYILYRGLHSYLVLNIYPYNAGHLLAVPYRAIQNLADLTAEERMDLLDTVIKAQSILTTAMKPEGFNIGVNLGQAGGAGIPQHLHIHIVPRWNGDTNFMPVIGKTKTLPQALSHLWERLRPIADTLQDPSTSR